MSQSLKTILANLESRYQINEKAEKFNEPLLLGPLEFASYRHYLGYPSVTFDGDNESISELPYKTVAVRRNPRLMMFPEMADHGISKVKGSKYGRQEKVQS